MFRPKHQQKLTLAFIVLVSASILFAEPVFAQKAAKSRKSGESTQAKQQASKPAPAPRTQQASKPAPAPKAPQQSSASRSRSSSPSSSRSSQTQARQRSSGSTNNNNSNRTPAAPQSSRTTSGRSSRTITSSNTNSSKTATSSNTRKPSSVSTNTNRKTNQSSGIQQSSNSTNRAITRSSSVTQRPAASSNNRISSSTSTRFGNPIGTQPQSTSTINSQPTKSSTNRISTRIGSIFGSKRTPPPTVATQPAASSNNRISSSKSLGIGNVIGQQSTSASRTSKLSTTSSTNRNKSITDSVRSPTRTPPSNAAKQPAVSSKNRVSSIDRADSRIGSVIGPERTPPPNAANQSAASLNSRINSSKSRGIYNPIGTRENRTPRTRKQSTDNPENQRDSRIQDTINNNRTSDSITDRGIRDREPRVGSDTININNSGRAVRKVHPGKNTTIIDNTIANTGNRATGHRTHHFETTRPSRLIYRDRTYRGYDHNYDYNRYQHTYVDYYNRIRHQTIWPRYRFIVCYNRGLHLAFRYVYPYYHRKYVFVSLGGFWPEYYRYTRYYWYGCHPYYWYGYYPIAREVQGDTYNYYTYNYYYDEDGRLYQQSQMADAGYYENLAQQPAEEPAQATLADSYFEEAVEAFEASNYDIAIDKFATAMEFAPDDMVLPFAYCQALLAAEQYSKAAEALRTALTKINPEKEGIFYPRGLYPNEEILLGQLDDLAEKVEIFNFDADLQLLLGYQLLGIGQLDRAVTPLINAGRDLENADAAAVLLGLLEKIKTSEEESEPEEVETEGVGTEEIEPEGVEPEGIEIKGIEIKEAGANQNPVQSKIINQEKSTRTKETVLLATLCLLAGSTGIGHYFRA